MKLDYLLSELEIQGMENDSKVAERSHKQLNITRDTGEFLYLLVKVSRSENVLEVGTSNGYSTLWLASAIPDTGKVTTLEIQQHKIDQARVNFDRAGLTSKIEIIEINALEYFKQLDQQYDFIFLDAERVEYMDFAKEVISSLRPGGLLVCDNAVSHKSELEPFMGFIKESNNFATSLVPVGKGEFVVYKNA